MRIVLLAALSIIVSVACAPSAAAPSPTETPRATPSASDALTATPVRSPARTASPSPTATAIASPSPSATARPTATAAASPQRTAPPGAAAYCGVDDVLTPNRDYAASDRTYLDWTFALPRDYVPPDLVSALTGGPAPSLRGVETLGAADVMARAGDPAYSSLLADAKDAAVRGAIYPDLVAMRAAAQQDGVPLVILSAYRSFSLQVLTFDYWVGVGGFEQALRTSARPGHSEHQLGTTIDFGDGIAAPWEYTDFATRPAGAWLAAHAAEYGFVMSFPKDGTKVTCYDYEPWHYRWVGKDLALRLRASGEVLRVYQGRLAF